MSTESLKEAIKRELPGWLREDPELRAYILGLTRQEYAARADTQDRFYEILAELRRDREEQSRKWEEQSRKWDEQSRRWEEDARQWHEQNHKWDETARQWHEQNHKWEESEQRFNRVHEEIMEQPGGMIAPSGPWVRDGAHNRKRLSAMRWPEFLNRPSGCKC